VLVPFVASALAPVGRHRQPKWLLKFGSWIVRFLSAVGRRFYGACLQTNSQRFCFLFVHPMRIAELTRPPSHCRVSRFVGRKTTLTCAQSSRTRRRWRDRRTRRRCFCSSRTVCCRSRLSALTVRAHGLIIVCQSLHKTGAGIRPFNIECVYVFSFNHYRCIHSQIQNSGNCIKSHPRSIAAISGACFQVPIMRCVVNTLSKCRIGILLALLYSYCILFGQSMA
jgi:hypothetical protein